MTPLVRLAFLLAILIPAAAIASLFLAPRPAPADPYDVHSSVAPSKRVIHVAALEQALRPEPGWWWTPSEPGRGFIVERSGDRVRIGVLAYEASGRATWYAASAQLGCRGEFNATLVSYGGGPTLAGPHRKPDAVRAAGPIEIQFFTETEGALILPNGRVVDLERYPLDGGKAGAFEPEPGWWANPGEPGRSFAIEARGGALLLTAAMYDEAGEPVWYVASGQMDGRRGFKGRWQRMQGGMTLEGWYRAPSEPVDAGPVTLHFADTSHAVLTLPDGRPLAVSRRDAEAAQDALPRLSHAAAAPRDACAEEAPRLARAEDAPDALVRQLASSGRPY
jgi:hypothetical protein